jgi:NADH dehydrogenase/NADH:ubiquinone oxidoreductase subunit G
MISDKQQMTKNKVLGLVVDGKELEAEEGISLLQACLDNGIYIPNLCYLRDTNDPPASCRMCFVEIEGVNRPVTACTVRVKNGMVINTDTVSVRRLQRTAFQLLLSVHRVECRRCPANKKCELQRIAKFLKVGLRPKQLEPHLKEPEIDHDHPFFDYYPNRCVLCGKCVFVCRQKHGKPFLTFAKRGLDTVVSFYGEKDSSNLACKKCHACVEICPVAAITLKNIDSKTALA